MRDKLILGCGIGRCGTGFLAYYTFLNPRIAVWDGPGMGELFKAVEGKERLSLSILHNVWGDEYHEGTHGKEWLGAREFDEYYDKRLKERRQSDLYFISHVMGERWYSTYKNHFDCNIVAVYCARNIVNHFRSFKRWYYIDGFTAEEYCGRLRGSLDQVDAMRAEGIPVVVIRVADTTTIKGLRDEMARVMRTVGIPMSKEQTLFLKKRRRLGASKAPLSATDAELMAELETVEDFSDLKKRYENLI